MTESKRAIGSDLAKVDATTDEDIARQIAEDPDTAPEWTDEQFDRAEVWEGDRLLGHGRDFENGKRKPGRPKGSGSKELVTLRLDREILEHFRAGGPGWQTRLNDELRAMMPRAGTVKWFNLQRGYGFIQPEDGSKDVIVHISALQNAGLDSLHKGQKLRFELERTPRGRPSAVNLQQDAEEGPDAR
jgi:CspA family cold shock protein